MFVSLLVGVAVHFRNHPPRPPAGGGGGGDDASSIAGVIGSEGHEG